MQPHRHWLDYGRNIYVSMILTGTAIVLPLISHAEDKDVFSEVLALCKAGQVNSAISLANSATTKEPLNPNTWMAYGTALAADGQFKEASDAMFRAAESMKNTVSPIQGIDKAVEARAWLFEGMADKIAKAPTVEIREHVRKGCLYLESCVKDITVAESHFQNALSLAKAGGYDDAAKLYKDILATLPQRPGYKKAESQNEPLVPIDTGSRSQSDWIMERQGNQVIIKHR